MRNPYWHVEEDLKDGGTAEAALRFNLLNEALEGNVLMAVSPDGDFPDTLQEGGEGQVRREGGAQGEGVEEETDEAISVRAVTASDGSADSDVKLAGVTSEQHLKGGQQSHKQGDGFAA